MGLKVLRLAKGGLLEKVMVIVIIIVIIKIIIIVVIIIVIVIIIIIVRSTNSLFRVHVKCEQNS